MASTLIKNGLVYDGLGNAPKKADIYIKDDRIERIGETICREADLVVDVLLDEHFDNARMERIYPNAKKVEKAG